MKKRHVGASKGYNAPREARCTFDDSPLFGGTSAMKKTTPSWEQLDVGDFHITDICPEEESGDNTPS